MDPHWRAVASHHLEQQSPLQMAATMSQLFSPQLLLATLMPCWLRQQEQGMLHAVSHAARIQPMMCHNPEMNQPVWKRLSIPSSPMTQLCQVCPMSCFCQRLPSIQHWAAQVAASFLPMAVGLEASLRLQGIRQLHARGSQLLDQPQASSQLARGVPGRSNSAVKPDRRLL